MSSSKLGDTFLFGSLILLIGSIIRIGVSIYLPALPIIGKEFGIDSSMMSNTVSIYFIVFSFFIVISGVFSDRYGRKPLLLFGMLFFFLGSVLCSISVNYEWFMVGRIIQAFGASMIPGTLMAMIQDACNDKRAVYLIGWLAVLSGLFLVASPMIGGVLTHLFGWRANFWFLSSFTFIVFLLSIFFITETHEETVFSSLKDTLKLYFTILFSAKFTFVLMPTILFFVIQGIFLSTAPYIVMDSYGLSPIEFGLSNIFLVFGLFSGRYVGGYLFGKCQTKCVYDYGAYGSFVSALVFLSYGLGYINGLWWFLSSIAIFTFNLGMISPASMKLSISAFRSHSGVASSLQGALLFSASALGSFMVGLLIKKAFFIDVAMLFGVLNFIVCLVAVVALKKSL